MNRVSFVFLLLISFTPFDVMSEGSGWSGKSKIEQLYAVNSSQVIVKLSNFTNATGCNPNTAGHVLVDTNSQKTFYTLILSAFMAGKEVNFYLYGECKTTHWVGPSFAGFGHVIVY
ncbi:hypothetical protein [Shewanella woodyi]|uniref:Uncharacterized protein n=1 Tax=Shewanella woodyi (strain ATCC 51908 / MS32) TaxID=392500 RepID=B1KKB6_SHEWM|nr:hypothetical protein [Shewanella woodyi]ACA85756.1 conserved hypothetical protein [Shewanella woodyi ATCC 51908]